MNTEALILFLILLLGLVLCSFLGGNCGDIEGFNNTDNNNQNSTNRNNKSNQSNESNRQKNTSTSGASNGSNVNYDNYNHYNGSSTQLAAGSAYYGENGGSVTVVTNSDGSQSLEVILADGEQPMTFNTEESTTSTTTESYTNYSGSNANAIVFYGPNGGSASVITKNGQQAIRIQTNDGTYTFTQNNSVYNPNNTSNTQYYGSTGYNVNTYNGAYGGNATTVKGPNGNTAYRAEGPYGNDVAGVTDTTADPYYNGVNGTKYYGPNGGQAAAVSGPYGNTAYRAEGPYGNSVAGVADTTADPYYNGVNGVGGPADNTYYNSLPPGIPGNQIPPGDEDLYILKSQVVPPVCPVCPVASTRPRQDPCPACPPCARCPEPAFECKKVPNYNALDSNYLPTPVLNDFSTFGM